jgi:hypothetical protein
MKTKRLNIFGVGISNTIVLSTLVQVMVLSQNLSAQTEGRSQSQSLEQDGEKEKVEVSQENVYQGPYHTYKETSDDIKKNCDPNELLRLVKLPDHQICTIYTRLMDRAPVMGCGPAGDETQQNGRTPPGGFQNPHFFRPINTGDNGVQLMVSQSLDYDRKGVVLEQEQVYPAPKFMLEKHQEALKLEEDIFHLNEFMKKVAICQMQANVAKTFDSKTLHRPGHEEQLRKAIRRYETRFGEHWKTPGEILKDCSQFEGETVKLTRRLTARDTFPARGHHKKTHEKN